MEEKIPIQIILGPTASGKTRLSLELARLSGGEIICSDSMQIYRKMDIGTGKPSVEARQEIPHHALDLLDPWESSHVASYLKVADQSAEEIFSRGKKIFLVGGTPLYVKRFIEGISPTPPANLEIRQALEKEARQKGNLVLYHRLTQIDPEATLKIHHRNLRRIVRALEVYTLTGQPISQFWKEEGVIRSRYSFRLVGLLWPREILYERINQRVDQMFHQGWVEEVRELEKLGLSKEARQALGYREILQGFDRKTPLAKTKALIQRNTRHFARRQILWFRQFSEVQWIELEKEPNWKELAEKVLDFTT